MRSRLFPIINTCHKPCFCIGPIKLEMKTKSSIPDFEWIFNNWGCPICSGGTYCMPQWNTHTDTDTDTDTHTQLYTYTCWTIASKCDHIISPNWIQFTPMPDNLCFSHCSRPQKSALLRERTATLLRRVVRVELKAATIRARQWVTRWMTIGDGVGVTNGFGDIPGLPPNRYSILRQ